MNILITIYHGLGKGGAEVSAGCLARELQKRGHNIVILSTGNYEGLKCVPIARFHKWPSFMIKRLYLESAVRKAIREYDIDIVYAQDMLTTLGAIRAARKEGKKAAVHIRDYWFACPKSSCMMPDYSLCVKCSYRQLLKCCCIFRLPWEILKLRMIKKCWKEFNGVGCIFVAGNYEEDILRSVNAKCPIIHVNNAREFSQMPAPKNASAFRKKAGLTKCTALFFSSLTSTKGAGELMKIIEAVLIRTRSVQFVIAGDGPYSGRIRELSKKYSANVKYLGRLGNEEIASLLAASDMALFPAIWREPFGGAQIEAAAAKTVVIGDNVGGVRDKVFGIHIPAKNTKKWADTIIRLAGNSRERKKLAESCYANAKKHYNQKDYADKIEAALNGVVNGN